LFKKISLLLLFTSVLFSNDFNDVNVKNATKFNVKDIVSTTKWRNKKYNFILPKNKYKVTKKFGFYHNKDYGLTDFNSGVSINVKKSSKIKLPFKPRKVILLDNWEGKNLIAIGRSTFLKIVADDIKKFKGKYIIKGNTTVSLIKKRGSRYINPKTFFKSI
jgi:hypothetical protein